MQRYEYKVVPAPQKGGKTKGSKTPEVRFAASIEQVLNQMGHEGWEYQRAELLPSEERAGLTGSTVNWRNVLVFRRSIDSVITPAPGPTETPDGIPLAQPVPGPSVPIAAAPAPVPPPPAPEEFREPPLSLKGAEAFGEPKDKS